MSREPIATYAGKNHRVVYSSEDGSISIFAVIPRVIIKNLDELRGQVLPFPVAPPRVVESRADELRRRFSKRTG